MKPGMHRIQILRATRSPHLPTVGEVTEVVSELAEDVLGVVLTPAELLRDSRFMLIIYLTLRLLGRPPETAKGEMHGVETPLNGMDVPGRLRRGELDAETECAMRIAARVTEQTRRNPCYRPRRSKYDGRRRALLT